MRKILLGAVVAVFTLLAAILITGVIRKVHNKALIKEKIATLPSFSFMTLTNKVFSSSEIQKGPLLIIRFHPECEHCRYEISEILKSNIPASDTKVILISSAHADSLRRFLNQFHYSDYKSVIALADTSYAFGDIFGSDVIPSNYIYNKELNLVKVMYGEVKTETIYKYLNGSRQDK
jgi:hypothetical protein